MGTARRDEAATALLELVRRLLVVGQRRHGRGVRAANVEQVTEALGQHPCLPRTGGGDDPGATRRVADCGELVGRQIGLRRCGGRSARAIAPRCSSGAPRGSRRLRRRGRTVHRRPTEACRRRGRGRRCPTPAPPARRKLGEPCARATRSALRCGRRSCSPTPGSAGARGRTRSGGSGRGRAEGGSRAPAGSWSRRRAPPPGIDGPTRPVAAFPGRPTARRAPADR